MVVQVLMVNTVAPFILNQELKPLLLRSPRTRKFIVNVSAMEGQFSRHAKTEFHPHTNMAKAALNMMTRTAALSYRSVTEAAPTSREHGSRNWKIHVDKFGLSCTTDS